jgi:hypothetical protein
MRYLNAERIKADAAGAPLKWEAYKALLYARLKDSTAAHTLIDFTIKPREDGLPVSLWAAERRAERELLTKDNTAMAEATWMQFVLSFVPNEERIILQVPNERDAAALNAGAGYLMTDFEAAVAASDHNTFKRFRQSACTDPLAKRIIAVHKAIAFADSAKGNQKQKVNPDSNLKKKVISANEKSPKLPSAANEKSPKAPSTADAWKSKPAFSGDALKKLDTTVPGGCDTLFKAGTLRKKLLDRVKAKQCVRCGSAAHLRSACPDPRGPFEDDFDRGPAFWSKQHRATFGVTSAFHGSLCLRVHSPAGVVGIDTMSDVTTALRGSLTSVRPCPALPLQHLGGTTALTRHGRLCLGSLGSVDAYVATADQLPPHCVAILGMPDITRLGLSVDHILHHNGCDIDAACAAPVARARFAPDDAVWTQPRAVPLHPRPPISAKTTPAQQFPGRESGRETRGRENFGSS